jgi:hypothetical protein
MRISKAPNVAPWSTPPSSPGKSGGAAVSGARDEAYIWTSLVPRLIHPAKLILVKSLIRAGDPQSVDDLITLSELDGDPEEVQRHATDMVEAGALEVVSSQGSVGDGVPLYFFPRQEQ